MACAMYRDSALGYRAVQKAGFASPAGRRAVDRRANYLTNLSSRQLVFTDCPYNNCKNLKNPEILLTTKTITLHNSLSQF